MLFLTILPHIPGAWIRDAPVGTHCNNMESLTPSVPRCAGAPDGMGTKFFAVHPSSTASQQPTPRPSSGCGRALCEPQNTHLVGEGQGFVVLSTAGTQKREQEPRKEVSSEDGPQVGGSCPGVTQCIPPSAPLGGSFPWNREQTSCPPSFSCLLWDGKALFSVLVPCPQCSTDPPKNPIPGKAGEAPGWSKISQHRQQRRCKANSINTDRSGI